MGCGRIASRAPLPSVHGVRTGCRGRLFTAKLTVVVHYLAHQLLNQDPILLAGQFCDCLRDRVDDFVRFVGIDFA